MLGFVRFVLLNLSLLVSCTHGWTQLSPRPHSYLTTTKSSAYTSTSLYVKSTLDETTEKFGLEAGLVESLKKKDGGESAKSLLKRYGIAYLATSIPLALVSFIICYLLVDNGVDVSGLLAKVGIESDAGEKAGTFALAYAAHKAASPIRFPPTVALTPVVAKLIGKEPNNEDEQQQDEQTNKV